MNQQFIQKMGSPPPTCALLFIRFRLSALDQEGWPIIYGTATLSLLHHRFQLGATLKTRARALMTDAAYRWYVAQARAPHHLL